jgi:ribose 5-phosphate isomerase
MKPKCQRNSAPGTPCRSKSSRLARNPSNSSSSNSAATPDGTPFITDEGNIIYDCAFGPLADAEELAAELRARTGIVEHGLFLGMADDVIIAGQNGLRHLQRDPVTGQVKEVAID